MKNNKILLASLLIPLFYLASCNDSGKYSKRTEDNSSSSSSVYEQAEYKKLLSPTNIIFDEDTYVLSWDAVDGATYYAINVNGTVIVSDCTDTSYELSKKVIDTSKESEFLISIRAINEDQTVKSSYSSYLYDISSSKSSSVFKYSLNEDGNAITIDGFNPLISYKEKTLKIYSEIGGIKVTKIAAYAFKSNANLTEVTIPSSIVEIGEGAFYQTFITTFNLSEGLKKIGNYAFYNSYRATTFNIPDSVEEIGDYAFYKVIATKINFSDKSNLTKIGAYAFAASTKFKTFDIPANVSDIGEYAFANTYVQTINFKGDKLTYLPKGCFSGARLTSFTLPSFIVSLGESCFEGASYLAKFYYDKTTIKEISKSAFSNTKVLKLFVPIDYKGSETNLLMIPESVEVIGESAFSKTVFTSIKFSGNNLKEIATSAFASNTVIKNIELPASLEKLGGTAFSGCKALESISVAKDNNLSFIGIDAFKNTAYLSANTNKQLIIGNVFYQASSDDLKASSITIPNNVVSISGRAFYKSNLTSLTLPTSVKHIGENAFASSSKLVSVALSNVEVIESSAFESCTSLTSVDLSNAKITEIADATFKGCNKLSSITIPSDVVRIGKQAFFNTSKYSSGKVTGTALLASVEFVGNKVEVIDDEAFSGQVSLTSFKMPTSVTKLGDSAFYNTAKLNVAISALNVKVIGKSTFENSGINEVTLGSNLKQVNEKSFNNCANLASVTFDNDAFKDDESVKSIPSYSFANCPKLASITLPDAITQIKDYAFLNDTSLLVINCKATDIDRDAFNNTAFNSSFDDGMVVYNGILLSYTGNEINLVLPDGVTTISSGTFKGSNIESISLPNSIEVIEDSAFEGCKSLTSVIADANNSNLKLVGANAFKDCVKLTSVSLSNKVTNIGDYAFFGDLNLSNVKVDSDGLVSVGDYAFANCNKLTAIDLGNSISYIGKYSFYHASLEDVVIPASVLSIGEYAFFDNGVASNPNLDYANWEVDPSIKSITFNEGSKLISVGKYAFANNIIENIIIPDNEGLFFDEYALANSTNLKNIVIPNSVKFTHATIFNASSLQSLSMSSDISITSIFGGYVSMVPTTLNKIVINEGSTTINAKQFSGLGMVKEIVLPSSISYIGDYAFYGCRSIKNINLTGVNYIGKNAFNGCVNLDDITFGNKIEYIGDKALFATGYLNNRSNDEFVIIDNILVAYNGLLDEVTLADDIEMVAGGAFAGNHDIKSLTLGANTKKLCNGAFDSCSCLSTLKLTYNGLVEIELEIFDSLPSSLSILINKKNLSSYLNDVYWSLYEDNVKEY